MALEVNVHHIYLLVNTFFYLFIKLKINKGSPNATNGVNGSYTYRRKRLYAAAPGRKCMCIKSYLSNLPGELTLNKGDIVESKINNIFIFLF